jgi:hypothetical protein
VASNSLSVQRRRSERLSESLPVLVRGIDLLGQPFEERTVTVNLNLHGCRYASKHQLPRNSWVTLELVSGEERRNVRARVAWVLRPHSIRDFFQVAVELEGPANIWGVEAPPADWTNVPISSEYFTSTARGLEPAGEMSVNFTEGPSAPMNEPFSEYVGDFQAAMPQESAAFAPNNSSAPFEEQPIEQTSGSSGEEFNSPEPLPAPRTELDHLSTQVRAMIEELDQKAAALHVERDSAAAVLAQLADARLQADGAAASSASTAQADELTLANWRARLDQEMAVAQAQWSELVQSSLDRGLQRLAEQLPERTQQAVREAEERMAEQATILAQAAAQISSQAHDVLTGVKASVDQELWKARDLLENSRSEAIERAAAEAANRIGSHANHVQGLLRELSGREEQASESLRLHRERLRQVSDNILRELGPQMEAAAARLREFLEAVKSEMLAKWNEELEASGARAAQAAGESIGRSSEWFQQEALARLQVLVEQNLTTAAYALQEETSKAQAQFTAQLDGQSIFHLAQAHQRLDGVANDLTTRSRTQIEEAAEAAASSFGQVVDDMSAQRAQQFNETTQNSLRETNQHFEWFTQQLRSSFETDSTAAMENVRWQVASHLEATVGQARGTLSSESAAILDAHRSERDARWQEVSDNVARIANDAVAQCHDRLQTAADSWTVASVRRLNEHGQNLMESLTRSTDQTLRESASRIFESLASTLRQPETGASAAANYATAGSLRPDAQPDSMVTPPPYENYSG